MRKRKNKEKKHRVFSSRRSKHDGTAMSKMCAAVTIVDVRKRENKKEYLVRWHGFSCKHDSWSDYVTPALLKTWNTQRKTRSWSKLIAADYILDERGEDEHTEYLVKFSEYSTPEWTPFVTQALKQTWQTRCRRVKRKMR